MEDLGEKSKLKEIFITNKLRTMTGKSKIIPNTAQNLYLNDANKKHQITQNGGTKIKKILESSDDDYDSDNDNSEDLTDTEDDKIIPPKKIIKGGKQDTEIEPVIDDTEKSDSDDDDKDIKELDEIVETVETEETESIEDPDDAKIDDKEEVKDEKDDKDEKETDTDIKGKDIKDIDDNDDDDKDTEKKGGIEDCLYQYDDLVDTKVDDQPREVPREENTTDPHMTYYERNRILGISAKQIEMGRKVMVKHNSNMSAKELALQELNQGMAPLIIRRPLPDNTYETWEISELLINDDDKQIIFDKLHESFDNKKDMYALSF
jgi:DNA-directed RNA polymerase I, II, and III subunit RPABC2